MINKLYKNNNVSREELTFLIQDNIEHISEELLELASKTRDYYYGRKIFFRGLIEISSYCKNNCFYCGIRASNSEADRYRLNKKQILACCQQGYNLGFRTFVLQGGEDMYYSDDILVDIIRDIKGKYPDCALTLSLGEKSFDTYKRYYDAGADRYLLRHESATDSHYKKLHPEPMNIERRKRCLYNLKKIGFQIGAGFMVGSPYQTTEHLVEDLLFLKELNPHMVGIGPFIPHKDSIFAREKAGDLNTTILMIALTRLLLPKALIPATTALATLDIDGRKRAFNAGANVVMPNLSPESVRDSYNLYNNKKSSGQESASNINTIEKSIEDSGFVADFSRGDYYGFNDEYIKNSYI